MLSEFSGHLAAKTMGQPVPLPPPGFDELSADEKVSYVQSLWDHIAADEADVPVPDWHGEILRKRLQELDAHPGDSRSWEEVRSDLQRDLKDRESER